MIKTKKEDGLDQIRFRCDSVLRNCSGFLAVVTNITVLVHPGIMALTGHNQASQLSVSSRQSHTRPKITIFQATNSYPLSPQGFQYLDYNPAGPYNPCM